MRNRIIYAFLFFSIEAFAGVGPISLGNISIGMSKSEYVTALEISPTNCNEYRDKDGKTQQSEMSNLSSARKTLCWDFEFSKTGSIENIQVEGVSYDVIAANYESSKYVTNFGHSSKAIFLKDKLISLEIFAPKVDIETLTAKYGAPKIVNQRKLEVCRNKIGNEFKNSVGNLDAVWTNREVISIFRNMNLSPDKTCTDGINAQLYILENPKELIIIKNAIDKYRNSNSIKAAKDSKF